MTKTIDQNTDNIINKRKQAFHAANDALRKKIDWILDWFHDESKHSLISRYELGLQVKQIYDDIEYNHGKRYGSRAMETISLFIPEDISVLTVARRLATLYTREQLDDIAELVMADGITPISYSHVRQLLSVSEIEKREELLNLTIKNNWTSSELGEHLKKLSGGSRSNNPDGRSTAIPKDATAVIKQQLSFAEDFENRNIRVWKNPQHSLPAQLDKLEPAQYSEDLARQLGILAKRLRQVALEANARAEEAEKKYEEMTKHLTTGKQLTININDTNEDIGETPTKNKKRLVG